MTNTQVVASKRTSVSAMNCSAPPRSTIVQVRALAQPEPSKQARAREPASERAAMSTQQPRERASERARAAPVKKLKRSEPTCFSSKSVHVPSTSRLSLTTNE